MVIAREYEEIVDEWFVGCHQRALSRLMLMRIDIIPL